MASQPPANLPLFYKDLMPLSSSMHSKMNLVGADKAPHLANAHAIPITVDEFVIIQRYFPIVFSVGDNPVPLALMGLNEGVNVFVDAEGNVRPETYVPAYVRRYPFMLARLQEDAKELSLCFDPTSEIVGEAPGEALFDDGKPSEALNGILRFCEEFEMAAQRTNAFVKDLLDNEMLIDGEVSIQPTGVDQPFVYRGFQMISEEKMRDLRGDELRKFNQNGALPLMMAHLFSLPLVRDIFARQVAQGKVPELTGTGERTIVAN